LLSPSQKSRKGKKLKVKEQLFNEHKEKAEIAI
jgi:hypothetical protein